MRGYQDRQNSNTKDISKKRTQYAPLQISINYWEKNSDELESIIDEFSQNGINEFTTFVPWHAVEFDFSHSFLNFLKLISKRKIHVRLIISPELGIHYPNSGLPKDVLGFKAQSFSGKTIPVTLPPNVFGLPSLFSTDFTKRYYGFLARINTTLKEFEASGVCDLGYVSLVLTGSYWKYYRIPHLSALRSFYGPSGDISRPVQEMYRKCMDRHFAQKEFCDPDASAATRWKVQAFEGINRRWFYQQSEDVFRNWVTQLLTKNNLRIDIEQLELSTPEADPSLSYTHFLKLMSGAKGGDFLRLSSLVSELALRASSVNRVQTHPVIHWSSLGDFLSLKENEKQFLVLKSLLLMGSRGGGVLVDERAWFAFSKSFRNKVESLAGRFASGELSLTTKVNYLGSHLWSGPGVLWDELVKIMGTQVRFITDPDLLLNDFSSEMVLVDPTRILTEALVAKLLSWSHRGGTIVLPQSPLYSPAARRRVEDIMNNGPRMRLEIGVPYEIFDWGNGQVVFYEIPEEISLKEESTTAWKIFLESLLPGANVNKDFLLSNSKIEAIPIDLNDGMTGDQGLFLLNPGDSSMETKINFKVPVMVSDFGAVLAHSVDQNFEIQGEKGDSFELVVPSKGVLPIGVHIDAARNSKNIDLTRNVKTDEVSSLVKEQDRIPRELESSGHVDDVNFVEEVAGKALDGYDSEDNHLGNIWN